jgi:hypothetical protein
VGRLSVYLRGLEGKLVPVHHPPSIPGGEFGSLWLDLARFVRPFTT